MKTQQILAIWFSLVAILFLFQKDTGSANLSHDAVGIASTPTPSALNEHFVSLIKNNSIELSKFSMSNSGQYQSQQIASVSSSNIIDAIVDRASGYVFVLRFEITQTQPLKDAQTQMEIVRFNVDGSKSLVVYKGANITQFALSPESHQILIEFYEGIIERSPRRFCVLDLSSSKCVPLNIAKDQYQMVWLSETEIVALAPEGVSIQDLKSSQTAKIDINEIVAISALPRTKEILATKRNAVVNTQNQQWQIETMLIGVPTGKIVSKYKTTTFSGEPFSYSFSPNGQYLLVRAYDKSEMKAYLFDNETGVLKKMWIGVTLGRWSENDSVLILAQEDNIRKSTISLHRVDIPQGSPESATLFSCTENCAGNFPAITKPN